MEIQEFSTTFTQPTPMEFVRGMPLRTGSRTMSQPPVNEFANMSEVLCAGNPSVNRSWAGRKTFEAFAGSLPSKIMRFI